MRGNEEVKPILRLYDLVKELDRKVIRLQGDVECVKKSLSELKEQRIMFQEKEKEKEVSSGWFFS